MKTSPASRSTVGKPKCRASAQIIQLRPALKSTSIEKQSFLESGSYNSSDADWRSSIGSSKYEADLSSTRENRRQQTRRL